MRRRGLHGLGPATERQRRRFIDLQEIGCIACRQLGFYTAPDIHHITHLGHKGGHDKTIPLCPFHHRGVLGNPLLGPSLALEPRRFRRQFGSDELLLERTNTLLRALEIRRNPDAPPPPPEVPPTLARRQRKLKARAARLRAADNPTTGDRDE